MFANTQNIEVIVLLNEFAKQKTIINVFKTFILPILIAFITFYVTYWIKESKERKRNSLLGAVICESLLEEVTTGIKVMNAFARKLAFSNIIEPNSATERVLPKGAWEGMKSINDQTLERLLMLRARSEYSSFPINGIRIHTKNYF